MALILKDRVRETTLSSGTSDAVLAGPVTGFQAFSVLGNGNTTYYCIAGQGTNEWEVGVGTYVSGTNTLERTTVIANSAGTEPSLLSFSAGIKDIFVTYPAEKSVSLDANGNVSLLGTVDVDNLRLDANTLSSTNTNGNITIDPNGTGRVIVDATSAVKIAAGTTAQRPTGEAGDLRFNSTTNEFEGHNGTAWASVGGSAINNDLSTASDLYPLFANATSGTAANVYTSNAKLLYKPSTGELKSSELVATNGLVVNSATVSANYTIPTGSNAMSAGPVSVASGVAVTVSAGSVWTIV